MTTLLMLVPTSVDATVLHGIGMYVVVRAYNGARHAAGATQHGDALRRMLAELRALVTRRPALSRFLLV